MATIIAESADTTVQLSLTVNDSGPVTGLTIAASVYDPSAVTNKWLTMSGSAWQPTQSTANMTEVGSLGHYVLTVNPSQAFGTHLQVFYQITAGSVSGVAQDTLILVGSLDPATAAAQASMQGDVTAVLADTDAINILTASTLDATVGSRAAPGASMALVNDALTAAAVAASAVTEIQAGLATGAGLTALQAHGDLTWATASVAGLATSAELAALEAHGDLAWATAVLTGLATSAEIAALEAHGDGAWATATGFAVAGDAMALTGPAAAAMATLTWDELRGASRPAGSFGAYLDASVAASGSGGTGLSQQEVRDALLLAPTGGPGSGAPASIDAHLEDILTTGGPGPWTTGSGSGLDAAGIRAAIGLASANLDTQLAEGDYLGKIWIDTVNGTPGTVVGTHGTSRNPVSTLANAMTLSAATGIKNFFLRAGAVTFVSSHLNEIWEGNLGARITFQNQDCSGSMFKGVTLYGVAGGTGDIYAQSCVLDTVSGGSGVFRDCLIMTHFQHRFGAFCDFDRCRSFASFHNVNDGRIRWNGHNGYTLFTNMTNAAHTQEIYSEGGLANFDASNSAGTINFTGPSDWYRDGGDNLTNGIVQALLTNTLYNQIFNIQGPNFGATFDPATDSLEAIRDRGDAQWNTATGFSTHSAADVDALLSAAHGAGGWSTATAFPSAGDIDSLLSANHGAGSWLGGGGLTAEGIADEVWDRNLPLNHVIPDSAGDLLQAAGAGGVAPSVIAGAVWNAATGDYTVNGSMGQAQGAASTTVTFTQLLESYLRTVRKYGPVLVKQPLAGKDEVHAGDVGVVLTIPVLLDGAYSDMSDATAIDFLVLEPGSETPIVKSGLGVTTATGSYATLTTDAEIFDRAGRWSVQVRVTWPDTTTVSSTQYVIDVQSVISYL